MTKEKCNFCLGEFNLEEVYPITYRYNVSKPRYCNSGCQGRASNLRQRGLNAYKNITEEDKNYLKRLSGKGGKNGKS